MLPYIPCVCVCITATAWRPCCSPPATTASSWSRSCPTSPTSYPAAAGPTASSSRTLWWRHVSHSFTLYFLGRLLSMQSRVQIRHSKKNRPKNLLCYNVKYCREKMNKKYTFVASARAGAAHFYLMNFIVFIDSYEHIIYNLSVNHKMLSSYGQCNEILYPSFFKRKTHLLIFEQ